MELCQSTTKENLLRAFAGESQARNRYDFAAQACKEKKLYVLEALFKYTAEQEKQHELDEFGDIYPAFAEKAQEEGFAEAARHFRQIADIEKVHAQRFERFAKLMAEDKLFVSSVETGWMCLNCGHVLYGTKAPGKCPVCDHDQGYFIRLELSPYER